MRIHHQLLVASALLIFGCDGGAGDGDSNSPQQDESDQGQDDSQYAQASAACADDAQACAEACVDGSVDLDALQACADQLRACIEANGGDPSVCAAEAEACLGDGTSSENRQRGGSSSTPACPMRPPGGRRRYPR